jgi:hypothetical protein
MNSRIREFKNAEPLQYLAGLAPVGRTNDALALHHVENPRRCCVDVEEVNSRIRECGGVAEPVRHSRILEF